jgi:outer membrane receptor protein involved in Fe transport
MYYSQIGNTDLEPEEAHQINAGLTYYLRDKKWMKELMLRADVFQNFVANKIVAIPTKDLFVWSILNVDKVSITGVDVASSIRFDLAKRTSMKLAGSYSFQSALNRTVKEHLTYNNQVAYIPQHSANSTIGFDVFGASIYWSSFFTGKRFHLNENNQFNELNAFWYSDLSIGYGVTVDKKHRLQFNFVIGNLADLQYEVVKSFPMMGRYYNIKISYAIN